MIFFLRDFRLKIMENPSSYPRSIPLNATSAINTIKDIKKKILIETKLSRGTINSSVNDPLKKQSFQIIDSERALMSCTSSFNICINDIRNLAKNILLSKIAHKEDPTDLQGYVDDLEAIQRSLLNVQTHIAEFHIEHDAPKKNEAEFVSEIWLRTQKDWLIKQVNDLLTNIEFTISIYQILFPS